MTDRMSRAEWFAEQGIRHQVVGPWLDLQGQELTKGRGCVWARLLNDSMADMAGDGAKGLSAHASLHLANPDRAAQELRRAVDMGMRSAMIPTSLPAGRLAERRFDGLWSAAVALDVPLLLHATTASPPSRLLAGYPSVKPFLGRYMDATLVASEMIVAGILDRFPRLRLVLPHGGAFLFYQTVRGDRNRAAAVTSHAPGTKLAVWRRLTSSSSSAQRGS
jgi:predicted TIM-barrel fold metal-dependent hydrolase